MVADPSPDNTDAPEFTPYFIEARPFLKMLRPHICLSAFHPSRYSNTGENYGKNEKGAAKWLGAYHEDYNLFYTVNIVRGNFRGPKPGKDDIVAARFLHCDIDPPKDREAAADWSKDAVVEELQEDDLPPTVIIDSGNGIQALWALDAPCENLDSIEDLNRRLIKRYAHLGADGPTWNIDRLLRIPGFLNRPDAKKRELGRVPTPARIIQAHDGTEYSPTDFMGLPEGDKPAVGTAERAYVELGEIKPLSLEKAGVIEGSAAHELIMDPQDTDKSKDFYKAAGLMVWDLRTDEEIAGVLNNPELPIHEHIRGKSPYHKKRAITRAISRKRVNEEGELAWPNPNPVTRASVEALIKKIKQELAAARLECATELVERHEAAKRENSALEMYLAY